MAVTAESSGFGAVFSPPLADGRRLVGDRSVRSTVGTAGGLFVVIMNGAYYESGGFEQVFRRMENDGLWRIQRLEQFNYMTELERPGWLLVAAKQLAR